MNLNEENEVEGGTTNCVPEDCRKQLLGSAVPQAFRSLRLQDYPHGSDQHHAARQAAQAYVADTRKGARRSVYIYGPPGTAKTFLASCVWNELAPGVADRKAYDDAQRAGTADNVAFVSGAELVAWFRGDDPDDPRRPAQRRYHIATCYLAVLDDLDKFPCGEWANALFDVIDSRLCQNPVPTIVTTNLAPHAFAQRYGSVGESIVSRFVRAGAVFIKLDAKAVPNPPESVFNWQVQRWMQEQAEAKGNIIPGLTGTGDQDVE
jgi:DNA replication protein DnaC